MNRAALLGLYHADRVLAWENGHSMTHGRFLSDVEALADLLPEKPTVINLADDRYKFLVGFAAALVRGQTTLLPPSRAPGALAQMAREYGNSYCLVDGTQQVEPLPSYQIPKGTGSPTDTVKVPQIPIDHPAVVAFTSGSTGRPHPHSKTWGSLVCMAAATTVGKSVLVRIDKQAMIHVLQNEPSFSELFLAFLLSRDIRIQADLVDQLFNSSEKRLARILLLMAHLGKEGKSEAIIPKISQEQLAEMVGTTRSRVSFFMNKFRKLGFLEYNGGVHVHSSLLSVVLHD